MKVENVTVSPPHTSAEIPTAKKINENIQNRRWKKTWTHFSASLVAFYKKKKIHPKNLKDRKCNSRLSSVVISPDFGIPKTQLIIKHCPSKKIDAKNQTSVRNPSDFGAFPNVGSPSKKMLKVVKREMEKPHLPLMSHSDLIQFIGAIILHIMNWLLSRDERLEGLHSSFIFATFAFYQQAEASPGRLMDGRHCTEWRRIRNEPTIFC